VLTALLLIKSKRSALAELGSRLAAVNGVSEVYSVTGEWDFVALVRVRRQQQLAEVVTGELASMEGVKDTHTMVAFQQFSRHDLDAMFGLGAED